MQTLEMKKKDGVYKNEVFTIRLLEDDAFDKLPYKGISDSLGIADPATGDAFIRKTHIPEMDMATIQHEIQELLANDSFHEDADGIRHKKFFKDIIKPILPVLVGALTGGLGFAPMIAAGAGGLTGGLLRGGKFKQWGPSAALGALGGYGGAGIGSGAVGGFKAAGSAGKGFLGRIGGGIKGALGMPVNAGGGIGAGQAAQGKWALSEYGPAIAKAPLQGPVTQAQSALGYTNLSQVPANLLGKATGIVGQISAPAMGGRVVGQGTAAPGFGTKVTPGFAGFSGTAPTTVGTLPPNIGTYAPAPAGTPALPPPAPTEGILGKSIARLTSPEGLLGTGTLAASAIGGAPEFQMPPIISELENKFMNQGGISEVGIAARGELLKTLQARPAELYPVADDAFIEASLRGTRESYARAQEQLDASYNLAGMLNTGEHLAAKDKMQKELAQTESDFIALENDRRFGLAQQAKQDAVVNALKDAGLTDQMIVELASLDVQAAAMKYGLEVEQMATIKEALGSLGSELLTGAFQPQETQ